MLRILVIDDEEANIRSAKETLKGCDLTVFGSIKEADDGLSYNRVRGKFDLALVDLFMPIGDYRGAVSPNLVSEEDSSRVIPAGLVFALMLACSGTRTVIYSDISHHRDRIASLLGGLPFGGLVSVQRAIHLHHNREEGKNWPLALQVGVRTISHPDPEKEREIEVFFEKYYKEHYNDMFNRSQ